MLGGVRISELAEKYPDKILRGISQFGAQKLGEMSLQVMIVLVHSSCGSKRYCKFSVQSSRREHEYLCIRKIGGMLTPIYCYRTELNFVVDGRLD